MLHGSIKPSNIFLCGEDRVVLGDLALPLRGVSLQLDRLSYDFRYSPPRCSAREELLGRCPTSIPWGAWRMNWPAECRPLSRTTTSSSPACTTVSLFIFRPAGTAYIFR